MTLQAFPKPKHAKRKNHSRRNATRSRARMIRDLDAIARQEVFERDGSVCIRCNNRDRSVQWAHVLSRRHLCLRWDRDNAMTLCGGCHLFWHHEPALAVDWFIKNYRERWERIKMMLQWSHKVTTGKVNVRELWEARAGEREP